MVCTFFGHREINDCNVVLSRLYDTLVELIENRGVRNFMVGNSGAFDQMVLKVLRMLSESHNIDYAVVLSYPNVVKNEYEDYVIGETVYPEVLEKVPYRYRIDKINRWMISKCDMVITYINTHIGGAAKYAEICEKRGFEVIKLGKV